MRDLARRRPALAQLRYAERRDAFAGLTLAERFALIHRTNLWGAAETTSGLGSERLCVLACMTCWGATVFAACSTCLAVSSVGWRPSI